LHRTTENAVAVGATVIVAVTEIAEVIEGATAEDLVAVAGAVASADLGEAALVAHGVEAHRVEADRVAAALIGEAIGNAALAATPASRWPCAVWTPTETA
jgi:hypothetical protein